MFNNEPKSYLKISLLISWLIHTLFITCWWFEIEIPLLKSILALTPQIIASPPPPKPKPKEIPSSMIVFEKTPPPAIPPTPPPNKPRKTLEFTDATANPEADQKVKSNAIADRNTRAATENAPDPSAIERAPTQLQKTLDTRDLTNRNQLDADISKNSPNQNPDSPPPTPKKNPTTPKIAQQSPPNQQPEQPQPESLEQIASIQGEASILQDRTLRKLSPNPNLTNQKKIEPKEASPPSAQPTSAITSLREPDESPPTQNLRTKEKTYSPFSKAKMSKGSVSNRGIGSIDAEESPLGKYFTIVKQSIGKKWYIYQERYRSSIAHSYLKVRFYVLPSGLIEPKIELLDTQTADAFVTEFTIRAIRDTKLPPIPKEVADELPEERLVVEFDFLIH
jgi:hypothetical protein